MKNVALLIIFFFGSVFAKAQTVPSSYFAPDSVKALYVDDADRLALRKIYRKHLTYQDSIIIPQIHSDTILNAMIAVYNAKTLPARDTVVDMYRIHTFPNPVMNLIRVGADSKFHWMQQLESGNIPTGTPPLDSLIEEYHLKVHKYWHFENLYYWNEVVFKSDSNYNLPPLNSLIKSILAVKYVVPEGFIGDGNNIWDAIYKDHVELVYSIGWGDCTCGCTARRFWKFKVYYNCSVEFVGSYGSPLIFTGIDNMQNHHNSIFPNPFSQQLNIVLLTNEESTITIFDFLGKQVLKHTFSSSTTLNTNHLVDGVYFYQLRNKNGVIENGKVVKH